MAFDLRDAGLLAGLIAFLLLWAAVSTADAQDAENAHREYCEMVAMWDKDAAQDVAPEQRRGWPPFDGRDQCAKMQSSLALGLNDHA